MPHFHVRVRDEGTRVYDVAADSEEDARNYVETEDDRVLERFQVKLEDIKWYVDSVTPIDD